MRDRAERPHIPRGPDESPDENGAAWSPGQPVEDGPGESQTATEPADEESPPATTRLREEETGADLLGDDAAAAEHEHGTGWRPATDTPA